LSTEFTKFTYICKDGADITTDHKHKQKGHKHWSLSWSQVTETLNRSPSVFAVV